MILYVQPNDKMTDEVQLWVLNYLLLYNVKMLESLQIVFRNLQDSIAFLMVKIQ